MKRRFSAQLAFAVLAATWGVILWWQSFEHRRVVEAEQQSLILRANDIATSVGVVIRSQRRFSGIVTQDRLESALNDLVQADDLTGITLFNAQGRVVTAAGTPPHPNTHELEGRGEIWSEDRVTVVSPVDLGSEAGAPGEGTTPPTIVLPSSEVREEFRDRFRRLRSERLDPGRAGPDRDGSSQNTNRERSGRRSLLAPERFQELFKTQGLHRFALVLSTRPLESTLRSDRHFRWVVATLALLALGGCALAYQSLLKSSRLEHRLVRAKELNHYLQEMNLAAAGLAHETRNPLNLIRGMAQMISKTPDTSSELRERSQQITQEVDRITNQLNDFITYSKPRETRIVPVDLEAIGRDVMRTLAPDLEEKSVDWGLSGPALVINADEQLLRQVLFNLLINAIEALHPGGLIRIEIHRSARHTARLEIHDDGPGVPKAIRGDIFKPYFTSHDRGTGLGLAIVQQIVLAHDWEIDHLPREPHGSVFRISRLLISH